MKIQIVSDIHLEFAPMKLEKALGSEVLILAGDILPVALVNGELTRPEAMFGKDWGTIKNGIRRFFHKANTAWEKCYYVFGNHEYYHGDIKVSMKKFQQWLDYQEFNNITILDNTLEVYKDVTFVGSTMWTDLNKGNPITAQEVKQYMYDYKVIANGGYPLTTDDTIDICNYSKQYLMIALQEAPTDKKVVITHHAPTHLSVHPKYFSAGHSNYGFYSDLSDILLDYKPNLWVHGHMHDTCNYLVENTKVVCNPRGYTNIGSTTQENSNFNKTFALVV